MSNDRMTSEEIAFANLNRVRQLTEDEIQLLIRRAMVPVVAEDARHNPNRLEPPTKVTVAGAVLVTDGEPLKGRGWAKPAPLAQPPGQDIIKNLCDAVLPHGRDSKAG